MDEVRNIRAKLYDTSFWLWQFELSSSSISDVVYLQVNSDNANVTMFLRKKFTINWIEFGSRWFLPQLNRKLVVNESSQFLSHYPSIMPHAIQFSLIENVEVKRCSCSHWKISQRNIHRPDTQHALNTNQRWRH